MNHQNALALPSIVWQMEQMESDFGKEHTALLYQHADAMPLISCPGSQTIGIRFGETAADRWNGSTGMALVLSKYKWV